MSSSIFANCDDSCGWVAAVISVIGFGSFGVPVKMSFHKVDVHPLVMQSYKTLVCFLTCWLVILAGEEVRWTNWGLLSGVFWVPGATCGIYGIRWAGMAVAVGTWSSIIVMTSFWFGFVYFQEPIRNISHTCFALLLLLTGLIGMSRYSATPSTTAVVGTPFNTPQVLEMESLSASETEHFILNGRTATFSDCDQKDPSRKDRIVLWPMSRLSVTKRQVGVLAAVINGAWGGMNLVPLHYARQAGFSGAGYLISYAGGSMIVNTLIWVILWIYYLYRTNDCTEALRCLPRWHWKETRFPGILAGLLYSVGNFSAILAVTYLGQGTGYSFCQMQLLVGGLWGVFYFHEIQGTESILKWFGSALIALFGIFWLSYEHVGQSSGHR